MTSCPLVRVNEPKNLSTRGTASCCTYSLTSRTLIQSRRPSRGSRTSCAKPKSPPMRPCSRRWELRIRRLLLRTPEVTSSTAGTDHRLNSNVFFCRELAINLSHVQRLTVLLTYSAVLAIGYFLGKPAQEGGGAASPRHAPAQLRAHQRQRSTLPTGPRRRAGAEHLSRRSAPWRSPCLPPGWAPPGLLRASPGRPARRRYPGWRPRRRSATRRWRG